MAWPDSPDQWETQALKHTKAQTFICAVSRAPVQTSTLMENEMTEKQILIKLAANGDNKALHKTEIKSAKKKKDNLVFLRFIWSCVVSPVKLINFSEGL